ncbi:hypothetical protein MMC32_007128 [Xylographa parallela]|nr:hypothetical protein [Xylographa parallela]
MVNPFTALSLAGTVVQFVYLGNKLIKDGSELSMLQATLFQSCSEAADELLKVLEDLKVKGTDRQWQSFRQALRTSPQKDEIRKIEKKVDKLQQMLNTHLIAIIR